MEKTKTIQEIDDSAEETSTNQDLDKPFNESLQSNQINRDSFHNLDISKNYLKAQNSLTYNPYEYKNEFTFQENVEEVDETVSEEESNYLGQIFEGARINFDVNKENIETKIDKIIKKKERDNRRLSKKKYQRWYKVKGLLNFFLIMRSELFKRKMQGLSNLPIVKKKEPLQ